MNATLQSYSVTTTYNRTWIVERHGYRTPAQIRADQLGSFATAA